MEWLLRNKKLLSEDAILAPEFIIYKVSNAIWKHEHLLKDIEKGEDYVSLLFDSINAGKITLLSPNKESMHEAYALAKRNSIILYDAIFISMAIQLGLELRTFDKNQNREFESERRKATKATDVAKEH